MDNNKAELLPERFFQGVHNQVVNPSKSVWYKNNANKIKLTFAGLYLLLRYQRPQRKSYISIVKDKTDQEELFKFRYKLYCTTDKLLRADDYSDGLEKDEFDEFSKNFVVRNYQKEIIGTFRLIHDSYLGFPTEMEFGLDRQPDLLRKKTVEISRFMIEKSYRKTALLLDILRAIHGYSRLNNIEYWYGCAENWFIVTLDVILGPLQIINKPRFTYNAVNYPFLFKVFEIERNVEKKSIFLNIFFKKNPANVTFS